MKSYEIHEFPLKFFRIIPIGGRKCPSGDGLFIAAITQSASSCLKAMSVQIDRVSKALSLQSLAKVIQKWSQKDFEGIFHQHFGQF